MSDMERWLRERRVTEVECLVADLNGIARGKILPTDKFIRSCLEDTLRLPEMIFVQTVTGDYPEEDRVTDPAVRDVRKLLLGTLRSRGMAVPDPSNERYGWEMHVPVARLAGKTGILVAYAYDPRQGTAARMGTARPIPDLSE